jgi:REP element-mobilizing transposase RayT
MPRKARIDAPGAVHHIIIRGIERRRIFRDDLDRDRFLEKLGLVLMEGATSCFAWVLMKNHVHLLLRSGRVPIAMVMRRLLTSYAMYFNRRYRRHGQLFQNRYKSILCEEDPYLKELVRYIHLNPVRAKVVDGVAALRTYRFCGHGALMGKFECGWLDSRYVLGIFGQKLKEARLRYEEYVAKGVGKGRREDLTGGGLIRSIGGWEELKRQRKSGERIKGDERILGGSNFVIQVLEHAGEEMSYRAKTRAQSWDFKAVTEKVAKQFDIDIELLFTPSKDRIVSRARAVLCHLAVRRLSMSGADVARRLNLSPSMVSRAVCRAEKMGWMGDEIAQNW